MADKAEAKDVAHAWVVEKKGEAVLKEKPIPAPGAGQVLIKVEACSICAGDHITVDGMFPGLTYPRIPGHEIAGKVLKVGDGCSDRLKEGMHVGVGWCGGYCNICEACRDGDFVCCKKHWVTGIHSDGGYATHMVAREEAVVVIPEGLTSEEAAPLMCAGVTMYNSLRNQPVKAGDLVGVIGVGGLGHLGIQYANKMGFKVVAISSTSDKAADAKKFGAHHYIAASECKNIGEELQKLGGCKLILATAPDSKSMSDAISGLARNGTILIAGASFQPMQITPLSLISNRIRIQGWPSGRPKDVEDTLKFSVLSGVRSVNEVMSLSKALEGYKRSNAGKARFRGVISMAEK